MDKEQLPLRVRYEYEQDKDLSISYAHGVWGGINPQGELELNFYLESDKLPPYSERLIAPDGSMGHEIAPYDENTKVVTRRITSRVILSYHTARAVQEWLEEKIETLTQENEAAGIYYDDDSDMAQ